MDAAVAAARPRFISGAGTTDCTFAVVISVSIPRIEATFGAPYYHFRPRADTR